MLPIVNMRRWQKEGLLAMMSA